MSDLPEEKVQTWVEEFKASKREERTNLPSAPVYYNFYDYPLQDEKGRVDRQYRIDRVEGDERRIHFERNTKGLALIEVARLKKDGFTVHAILTPEELSLEGQARTREENRRVWQERFGG